MRNFKLSLKKSIFLAIILEASVYWSLCRFFLSIAKFTIPYWLEISILTYITAVYFFLSHGSSQMFYRRTLGEKIFGIQKKENFSWLQMASSFEKIRTPFYKRFYYLLIAIYLLLQPYFFPSMSDYFRDKHFSRSALNLDWKSPSENAVVLSDSKNLNIKYSKIPKNLVNYSPIFILKKVMRELELKYQNTQLERDLTQKIGALNGLIFSYTKDGKRHFVKLILMHDTILKIESSSQSELIQKTYPLPLGLER